MAQQSMGNRGLGQANPVPYAPSNPETVDLTEQDTSPSEIQPKGVDEEYQSLEEALTGE